MTRAYYNELDPYAAQWLRNLADAGHVAPGTIDDRSIADVRPDDIGDGQAHFFAGIGGWSLALRLAGVPDSAAVWTGSCPCQPFSTAGRGRGADDERHLWPVWYRLIAQCRPSIVFGEQVASKAGRQWLAAVRADMEDLGYAVGGADLCAAGVGAPHIRQRLWWVAYDHGAGRAGLEASRVRLRQSGRDADGCGDDGGLDDPVGSRCEPAWSRQPEEQAGRRGVFGVGREGVHSVRLGHSHRIGAGRHAGTGARPEAPGSGRGIVVGSDGDGAGASGAVGGLGHGISPRLEGHAGHGDDWHEPRWIDPVTSRPVAAPGSGVPSPWRRVVFSADCDDDGYCPVCGDDFGDCECPGPTMDDYEYFLDIVGARVATPDPWRDVEWVDCADGKRRPVEPGTFPLAHGVSGRVGRLRAYGNAIVPQLAAAFVVSALEAIAEANP